MNRFLKRFLKRFLLWLGAIFAVLIIVFYFWPIEVLAGVTSVLLQAHGARSRYVDVAGDRVHYWEMGPETAAAPKIMLLHGLGGQAIDWAPVMPRLARAGYHVYAPDLLGFGETSRPDIAYSIAQQTAMVDGFARSQGLLRGDLVGWSMGGWIAITYTVEHPERVRRLVLDDAAGLDFVPSFDPAVFAPDTVDQLRTLASLLEPKAPQMPRFVARDFLRRVRRNCCTVRRAIASMETRKEIMDSRIGAIHAPVLINWGADDLLIPLNIGRQMQTLVPGSDLDVFDNCGHLAPVRCSQRVTAATLQFLQSPSPPKGQVQELAGPPR